MLGKSQKESTKSKIGAFNKGNTYGRIKIKCISPDNELFIFESIKHCSEYLKVSTSSIHNFFNCRVKHVKNWTEFERI